MVESGFPLIGKERLARWRAAVSAWSTATVRFFSEHHTVRLWTAVSLIALVAYALRAIRIDTSWDIFSDEIDYTRISESVADTLTVAYEGGPFFLHPPLHFLMEGAFLKLVPRPNTLIDTIYMVRHLNAALAGFSASLIYLIVRRVVGWRPALIGAAIFAIEPFLIRISSRDYLEPTGTFCVLAGYCILIYSMHAPTAWWRIIGTGCAFGGALLSKETLALLTLMPLMVLFVLHWSLPRRTAAMIGVVAAAIYSLYPLTIYLGGQWDQFSAQKLNGFLRFAGVIRVTGFNQPGSHGPSFVEAILNKLGQFATTYALLALGVLAVGYLFLRGGPVYRLLAVWVGCGYLMQGYAIKFGTNEEPLFYFLVSSTIPSTVIAGALLTKYRGQSSTRTRLSLLPSLRSVVLRRGPLLHSARVARQSRYWLLLRRSIGTSILVVFFAWTSFVWISVHTTPDNAQQRLFSYLMQKVTPFSSVAVAVGTTSLLMEDYPYINGDWETGAAILRNHAQYALISTYLIDNHYQGSPSLRTWLQKHGKPVFAFSGPSTGHFILYRITAQPFPKTGAVALLVNKPFTASVARTEHLAIVLYNTRNVPLTFSLRYADGFVQKVKLQSDVYGLAQYYFVIDGRHVHHARERAILSVRNASGKIIAQEDFAVQQR